MVIKTDAQHGKKGPDGKWHDAYLGGNLTVRAGQTVNVAARVQGLASSRAIFVTNSVVEDPNAAKILATAGLQPTMQRAALRGIADETTVYEIP